MSVGVLPLQRLDALSPAKAVAARRMLLAGQPIDAARFHARGMALSKADRAVIDAFESEGLATRVLERVPSGDGSVRLVVGVGGGDAIETVAMPAGAVCISTQVGCAVRCRFCASGKDGLKRNLGVAEIVEQLVHARREMRIDRIVFMGIGEPTHNLDAVLESARRFRDDGLIGYRRQTLSTVGSRRAFERMLAAEVKPALALSLHSVDPVIRRDILPHAYDEPIQDLIAAADAYSRAIDHPVQIEWTLLAGINDRDEDVDALATLMQGVNGYVNFIVWNRVAGVPFEAPPQERVVEIVRRTKRHGVFATMRLSAGADVDAACGQLRRRVAGGKGSVAG